MLIGGTLAAYMGDVSEDSEQRFSLHTFRKNGSNGGRHASPASGGAGGGAGTGSWPGRLHLEEASNPPPMRIQVVSLHVYEARCFRCCAVV